MSTKPPLYSAKPSASQISNPPFAPMQAPPVNSNFYPGAGPYEPQNQPAPYPVQQNYAPGAVTPMDMYGNYPVNMPVFTDPGFIKEQANSCIARCPHCSFVGLTILTTKYNCGFIALGIVCLPALLIAILIFTFLVPERTHCCARCNQEIARKNNCCC